MDTSSLEICFTAMNCPQLVSEYNTPKISWFQTDLTVTIRIQLIDVPNYYLRVEDDHLLFRYIFAISNRKKGKYAAYSFLQPFG